MLITEYFHSFLTLAIFIVLFLIASVTLTAFTLYFGILSISEIWLFNAILINLIINVSLFFISVTIMFFKNYSPEALSGLVSSTIIATLFHISLFGIIVVSFDRSISVYFLASMYSHDTSKNYEELEKMLWDGYFASGKATLRRLDEQTIIGNISKSPNGSYKLTEKGENFIANSRIIAKIYGIQRGFLWPNGEDNL